MVYEYAGQLIAYCLSQQSSCNRGVNAAGQRQQNLAVTDLLADGLDGAVLVVAHGPVALCMADFIQEVLQHERTVLGVVYLRMILYAVEAALLVSDGSGRAHIGVSDQLEALRHLCHVVAVAHPGNTLLRQTLEQLAVRVVEGLGLAVLARSVLLCCGYLAAEGVRHKLTAVADAQNRYAQLEQSRITLRGLFLVNAVRTAGKDDADRIERLDLLNRGLIGLDLTVNIMFADASCNQLIVLTAEVEHQNKLMIFHRQSPFCFPNVYIIELCHISAFSARAFAEFSVSRQEENIHEPEFCRSGIKFNSRVHTFR